MNELKVDPARLASEPETGIYVRATLDGKWGSYDMNHLTPESLTEFLRSRDGENRWMEGVICALLGYPPYDRNGGSDE